MVFSNSIEIGLLQASSPRVATRGLFLSPRVKLTMDRLQSIAKAVIGRRDLEEAQLLLWISRRAADLTSAVVSR